MATSQNRQTNKIDDFEKSSSSATPGSGNRGTGSGNVTTFNQGNDQKHNPPGIGGGPGTGTAAAPARSFYNQAKETAGKAYEAVTDKTAQKLDDQRTTLSGGLATVADSVRQVSDNLGSSQTDSGLAEAAAKYTNTAADKIENVASYFETKSVREMARDLEGYARRNPALFIGAAFGLGLLAARFLKSTPPQFGDTGREFGNEAALKNRDTFSKPGSESPNLSTDSI